MNDTPVSLLKRLRLPAQQHAWARFVRLYTPLLYQWTRRLGLHEADAADLVQEVFVVLLRRLPEFRYDPHKSFRAWLHTILLNTWRNLRASRAGRTLAACPPDLTDENADGVAAYVEDEYRRHLVARALELMQAEFQPATWRACLECVVEDRPAAEVAAELGLSVNAVYLAKSHVLARLRRELDGLLD